VVTPGNPKDHLSFSRGVDWGVSPAALADWNRVLAASDQPFQLGPPDAGVAVQWGLCATARVAGISSVSALRRIMFRW
jgi:hypothetical protein